MPAVTINGHHIDVPAGGSLFEAAAQAGVRVPTSCVAQGKCKECIVEVTSGMDLLAPPTVHERHLEGAFRLSCQCRLVADEWRDRVPHDAARPHAHRAPRAEPARQPRARMPLDPASRATGTASSTGSSGADLRRVERSDPRTGDGSWDDDGRGPPDQSRDRRARGRCLVREPAAIRRVRRDVADSLRHGAQGQAAPANARGLSDARDRGVSGRSPDDLRSRRRREFDDAGHFLPAERVFHRTEPRTARSPRSRWPREAGRRPA